MTIERILREAPDYVLLFAIFSMLGWAMEVVLKYIQYHRFINRGFLIGPYCPIYGWGALLITFLAGGVFFRKLTPLESFLVGFFGCGTLEYLVSLVMEKVSHARWWDYSNKPMNLNGRVWIGNLTLFGVAAVAIVYAADPLVFGWLERMPDRARRIAACAFLVIIWTDRLISHVMMRILRDCIDHQQADDTEEVRRQMRLMLKDRSLFVRRMLAAYPELRPLPERLTRRLKAARAEYRDATKRLRRQLLEIERAGKTKRRGLSEELRARARQARDSQSRARDKLRDIERELFGDQ